MEQGQGNCPASNLVQLAEASGVGLFVFSREGSAGRVRPLGDGPCSGCLSRGSRTIRGVAAAWWSVGRCRPVVQLTVRMALACENVRHPQNGAGAGAAKQPEAGGALHQWLEGLLASAQRFGPPVLDTGVPEIGGDVHGVRAELDPGDNRFGFRSHQSCCLPGRVDEQL